MVFYSLIRTFAPEFKEPELMRLFFSLIVSLMVALTTVAQKPLHVVMLGDSNTWIGGDDCDKPLGWNKWFKDALQPTTCKSYARSGATWTNTPQTHRDTKENIEILGNNNVIYNQICRLQEAVEGGDQAIPQLILIMAGTNDAWFQKQRPKAFLRSDDTYGVVESPPFFYALDPGSGLAYDAGTRGVIPRLKNVFEVPIGTAAGHVAQIQRRGAGPADIGAGFKCLARRHESTVGQFRMIG